MSIPKLGFVLIKWVPGAKNQNNRLMVLSNYTRTKAKSVFKIIKVPAHLIRAIEEDLFVDGKHDCDELIS